MNLKCKKCDTTFEFSNKKLKGDSLKFKCSVCGHTWKWKKIKPEIIKKASNAIFPSYNLLIILNIIIIILVIISFFLFREKLEFIDNYWQNIYLFFDSLVPIQ